MPRSHTPFTDCYIVGYDDWTVVCELAGPEHDADCIMALLVEQEILDKINATIIPFVNRLLRGEDPLDPGPGYRLSSGAREGVRS